MMKLGNGNDENHVEYYRDVKCKRGFTPLSFPDVLQYIKSDPRRCIDRFCKHILIVALFGQRTAADEYESVSICIGGLGK